MRRLRCLLLVFLVRRRLAKKLVVSVDEKTYFLHGGGCRESTISIAKAFCSKEAAVSPTCTEILSAALDDLRTQEYYERVTELTAHLERREVEVELIEGHTATYYQKAQMLRRVVESAPMAPTVCEIGFNAGHSSLNFLSARNDSRVFAFDQGSVGVNRFNHSIPALYSAASADFLYEHFPGRFALIIGDSTKSFPAVTQLLGNDFRCHIIFIDGGHDEATIRADLANAKVLADPVWNRIIVDDLGSQLNYQRTIAKAWQNEIKKYNKNDSFLLHELDLVFAEHASCVNTPILSCPPGLSSICNCSLPSPRCCTQWCQSLIHTKQKKNEASDFILATQDESEWSDAVLWLPPAETQKTTATGFQNCKPQDPGYREPLFANSGYIALGTLVQTKSRRWLRLESPIHMEHIVSDVLLVSLWILDESEFIDDQSQQKNNSTMLFIGDGPSKERRLCLQVNDNPAKCYDGYGHLGLSPLGFFMVYADTPTIQGHHELHLWVEHWPEKKLTIPFFFLSIDTCAALAEEKQNHDRNLYEIFPYFGGSEHNLIDARLAELDGLVNTFILVEANLTHSGINKTMDAHLLRNVHRIHRIAADLSGPESYGYLGAVGDLKHAREEMQRDAGILGLSSEAKPDDLVLISDADELASGGRIKNVLKCARSLETMDGLLPLYLDMHWHVYDMKWRSTKRWGIYGREGAVIVSVAMLRDHLSSRPASAWRRQLRSVELRQYGNPRVRVLSDAGWHLSSFGGSKAVARKLKSYCDADAYGSDFYTDEQRLNRFSEHGIAYYDLLSADHSSFTCRDNRTDIPRFAQNDSTRTYFFGSKRCPTEKQTSDKLASDVAQASNIAAGKWMLASAKGIHFEPQVDCGAAASSTLSLTENLRQQLEPQCTNRGLNSKACDLAAKHMEEACVFERKAAKFIGNKIKQITSLPLDFQTTAQIPFTLDDSVYTVSISYADNVTQLAKKTCATAGIPENQCTHLEQELRAVQPPKWLLE